MSWPIAAMRVKQLIATIEVLAAQKVHANTFVYALIPVERPHTILGGATLPVLFQ